MNKVIITAPIFYVNGKPHLGHLYTSIAVDTLARYERLIGNRVLLSVGTDEHGAKVASSAEKIGKTPKEFTDEMHVFFKDILTQANVDYDVFIRTTADAHKQTATYVWNKLVESGLTYEGSYEGWYSKVDEAYYKEEDVLDGRAIETGSPVEYMKETCIFFKLSEMREKLIKLYEDNPQMIQPKSKYSEVMGLLKKELPNLAISRSRFNWGIPVPNTTDQVMYVWVDALANYLTALNYPKNQEYLEYWHNSVHVIGKDILKFHAIYWPAILMAIDLPPPARIFAHGWWNVDNQKMSKSLGNVIEPIELLDKYGTDCVRYFLLTDVHFGNDGNFSEEALCNTINVQLANELGNLVQRVLMFCYNKYGRTILCNDSSSDILLAWNKAKDVGAKCMKMQDITGYINACRAAVIETNKYIDNTKPWSMDDPQEVLGILCLCIQRIAILYAPILPIKSAEIAKLIGIRDIGLAHWDAHESFPLHKPDGVFGRV